MQLNQNSIKDLKKILEKDYKIILDDYNLQELGIRLLKVIKISKDCNEREKSKQKIKIALKTLGVGVIV